MAEALCPSKRKDLLVEAKELKRGKYNLNCNAIATQFHEVWVGEETLKNKLIKQNSPGFFKSLVLVFHDRN